MRIHKVEFIIMFYILHVCTPVRTEEECQTPDHHEGICIPVTECSSLYKLKKSSSASYDFAEYLRKSHCGFTRTHPKICCPNTAINPANQQSNVHLLPNKRICGEIAVTNRIELGDETSIDQYPWNALLKYNTANGRRSFHCGGVLISDRYVLTAAHCIKGQKLPKNSDLTSVRFKEHYLETNPDCQSIAIALECNDPFLEVPVEETVVHEDYNPSDPNQYHDIALIRLQQKLVFDSFLKPCCLPEEVRSFSENERFLVAGWGIDGHRIDHNEKKKNTVLLKDNSTCEDGFKIKVSQNQICIGKLKAGKTCVHDSGGSLMDTYGKGNFYAVGVNSLGSCNSEQMVYTRVDRYRNWILSKLKS